MRNIERFLKHVISPTLNPQTLEPQYFYFFKLIHVQFINKILAKYTPYYYIESLHGCLHIDLVYYKRIQLSQKILKSRTN